jgi:two-component system, chemotaxis family, protein-glutamate methylesterase/glutaminase
MKKRRCELLVIGGSSGSNEIINLILSKLPVKLQFPVILIRHIAENHDSEDYLGYLNSKYIIKIKEAEHGEALVNGVVYFAPPGYHLLVENELTLSLNVDEKIKFCRPAIDPLFESAADACGNNLTGVILTGANDDGSDGLKRIKDRGGYTIVQNPETAECPVMPQSALQLTRVDEILEPHEIYQKIVELSRLQIDNP